MMLNVSFLHLGVYGLLWAATNAQNNTTGNEWESSCRCFPGDDCWPSAESWNAFNASLGGKLIETIPIASPCHDYTVTGYDPKQCTSLQNDWFYPETHIKSASSTMAPFFMNNSCNPFLDRSTPCTIGNYPRFVVNATCEQDYQKTLKFATDHNIRLVIRNTGHDYNGKSTGAGSLALWTLHLKKQKLKNYSSAHYNGSVFEFGAGILAYEALEYADSVGLLVVTGNQPTVGLVGGYTQGGGHGPLASRLGLAADQVLEWEVVLATQEVVTASPDSQYDDLYWALCGGGGGTFAAVLSVTVKAHQPMTLSTADLTFSIPNNASEKMIDSFYEVIDSFTKQVPAMNDAGAVAIWFISAQTFTLSPIFGPGLAESDLNLLLRPVLKSLDGLKLNYTHNSKLHASYLEGFLVQPAVNVSELNIGGRLIPRSVVEPSSGTLTAAIRHITSRGALFSGVSFNVSRHDRDAIAANPYWRDSVMDAVVANEFNYLDWNANLKSIGQITNDLVPELESLTPCGAAYLNEADFQQPHWQKVFYGAHYSKLSHIKSKYDPKDLFYALGGVNSDRWTQELDGRLCKKLPRTEKLL
ncbi:FAD-binding domain-containing protein [Astrocystis sublimbata]|nr:FAD-binding domain-containing protein [Astrocystis sublimbata]